MRGLRGLRDFLTRNEGVVVRCGDSRVTVVLVVGRVVAAWIVNELAVADVAEAAGVVCAVAAAEDAGVIADSNVLGVGLKSLSK